MWTCFAETSYKQEKMWTCFAETSYKQEQNVNIYFPETTTSYTNEIYKSIKNTFYLYSNSVIWYTSNV